MKSPARKQVKKFGKGGLNRYASMMADRLKTPKLSPEEQARIQRAIDQGFTNVVYHSTNDPWDEIDLNYTDVGFHAGTPTQATNRALDKAIQAGLQLALDRTGAAVVVVMDADRFGISQLHQLRGRIGRGSLPGLCILVTDKPVDHPSHERLAAVAGTTDGFELAQVDLELRRAGDVLGAMQSGQRTSLRVLDVLHDGDIIAQARSLAMEVIAEDPDLQNHPALRQEVATLVDAQQATFLERG